VLEHVGGQEYQLGKSGFLERFTAAYGAEAAQEVESHISCHYA
jgi:adenosine kinase